MEFDGEIYEVYLLHGFAHVGDPEPAHHKYWNPELGTILIWFGEDRFFELIQTGEKNTQATLDALKKVIKQRIEKQ